jgi:hypothetical protein
MDNTGKSAESSESLQSPSHSLQLLKPTLVDLSSDDDFSDGTIMEISDTIVM